MSRLRRALLVVSAALLLTSAAASPAGADRRDDRQRGYAFAVIGDIPYGAPAAEAFPGVVDRI